MIQDTVRICHQCGGADVHETRAEVSFCPDCRAIEGGDDEITVEEYENICEQRWVEFHENWEY